MIRLRRILASIGVIAILFAYSGMACASEGAGISPDEALAKLVAGNTRFVEGKQAQKDIGNIGSIVKKIEPAVKKAKAQNKDKDKVLDAAILENTKNTAAALTQKSAIIKHLVEEKKVKIAAGVYNMSTGKVELVEASSSDKAESSHESSHEHAHAEHNHAGH